MSESQLSGNGEMRSVRPLEALDAVEAVIIHVTELLADVHRADQQRVLKLAAEFLGCEASSWKAKECRVLR